MLSYFVSLGLRESATKLCFGVIAPRSTILSDDSVPATGALKPWNFFGEGCKVRPLELALEDVSIAERLPLGDVDLPRFEDDEADTACWVCCSGTGATVVGDGEVSCDCDCSIGFG